MFDIVFCTTQFWGVLFSTRRGSRERLKYFFVHGNKHLFKSTCAGRWQLHGT